MKKFNKSECSLYKVSLTSKTQKLRAEEALIQLKKLYPYEISIDNIFIEKSDEKNQYSVYVCPHAIEDARKSRTIHNIIWIGSICLFILITLFLSFLVRHMVNANLKEKERIEKENVEKIKEQKQAEQKLDELKSRYEQLTVIFHSNIYKQICNIYECFTPDCRIESLSIKNDNYFFEISTNDAVKILENLENCSAMQNVVMNKTLVKSNQEIVSYSGTFLKRNVFPSETLPLMEKCKFYENHCNELETKLKILSTRSISEYTREIRNFIKKNGCKEETFQIRKNNNITLLECNMQAESKNILKFLQSIQNDHEVESLILRNDNGMLHLQILFWTGIPYKNDSADLYTENDMKVFQPEEINKVFGAAVKTETEINKKVIEVKNTYSMRKLNYIGKTKIADKELIIVKDPEYETLYKLEFVESPTEKDCCYKNEKGNYIASINKTLYEVKN